MTKTNRILALLLVLAMLVSAIGTASAAISPSSIPRNDGVRHEVCTSLSAQAAAYYTGDYTPETLLALAGSDSKSSLETTGSELFQALHQLMSSTMTDSITYKELTSYWPYTDATKGQEEAILFYSDVTESGYNREHVWPKSRASFYQTNGGSDLHHLRPTASNVNSTRSNYAMGNVNGVLSSYKTYEYGGKTVLWYNASLDRVEVADEVKGDVARVLLYVYCRWAQPNLFEDVSSANLPTLDPDDSQNDGTRVIESLDTLLYWMEIDPVDDWEMTRNDRIELVQGNRNVFIDYPELAWLLFDEPLPEDYETPSGYAKENGSEKFVITACSEDESKGTVQLINRTVSAAPAEGYYASGYTVSPEGACTVTQDGNIFRVSDLKQDCTITIQFSPKAPATVSFSAPEGIEVAGGNTASSFVGDSITLPTVTGQVADKSQEYTFLGWTAIPVEQSEALPQDLMKSGETYYVGQETQTLYALFYYKVADGTSTDKEYTQVMDEPTDWTGTYCIVATEQKRIMTNELNNTYLKDADITVENATVKNPPYLFTLSKSSKEYYYYLRDSQGDYIGCAGAKKLTKVTDPDLTDTSLLWRPGLSGLMPFNENAGRLQYNAGAPRFTTYSSNQAAAYLYAETTPTKTWYTSAQGHIHVFTETVTPATCTEDGKIVKTCTLCGEVVEEIIKAPGHQNELKESVSATCSREGYVLYVCSVCHEETKEIQEKFACPSLDFSDLPGEGWYHDSVDAMLLSGLMNGTGDGKFEPELSLSRAMVVTMLHRAAGEPEAATAHSFTDVPDGFWYSEAIAWAAERKIVLGVTDTTFQPDTPITREQLAAILYRYACAAYLDTIARAELSAFPDQEMVSEYAQTPLEWAVAVGLINGIVENDKATYLRPQQQTTRAQAATMLDRFLSKVEACTHDYASTVTEATCTEDGATVYTCKLCGYSYSETIPATGHSWGEWILTKAPTAATEGEETRVCSVCQAEETRTVAKLDYTLTKTDTLKAGDQVLIVCPSKNVALTNVPVSATYTTRLEGAAVTIENDAINMLPENAVLVTVAINANGQYSFLLNNEYLVCSNGSGSLYFTDMPSFNTWTLEAKGNGFLLRSVDAVKMYNETPVPVYVEYYNNNFTSYYFKGDETDFSAFTFQFFRYDKVSA